MPSCHTNQASIVNHAINMTLQKKKKKKRVHNCLTMNSEKCYRNQLVIFQLLHGWIQTVIQPRCSQRNGNIHALCVFWLLFLLLVVCCAAETKSNVREVIFWLFFHRRGVVFNRQRGYVPHSSLDCSACWVTNEYIHLFRSQML